MNNLVNSSKMLALKAWDSLGYFMTEIGGFLLKLLAALLIWFIGKWIAKILRRFFVKILKLIKLDEIADKIELDRMLEQIGIKHSFSTIAGNIIYYVLLLVVLLSVFDFLGLGIAKEMFDKVVMLIPNIFIAIVLFVFGMYIANFVKNFVTNRLKNMKIDNAETVGSISKFAILLIVFSMILSQLNIGNELISKLTQYFFAALFFGLAVAIGLGGKDLAKNILEKIFQKEE